MPSLKSSQYSCHFAGTEAILAPAVADDQVLGYKALYRTLLQYSMAGIAIAFRTLANPCNYPILVHCAHGKDRTGLVVMLLLMLIGVSREVSFFPSSTTCRPYCLNCLWSIRSLFMQLAIDFKHELSSIAGNFGWLRDVWNGAETESPEQWITPEEFSDNWQHHYCQERDTGWRHQLCIRDIWRCRWLSGEVKCLMSLPLLIWSHTCIMYCFCISTMVPGDMNWPLFNDLSFYSIVATK